MNQVIFVALKEEFPFSMKPKGIELVYTGIGKINAAIAVAKYLTVNPHVENDTSFIRLLLKKIYVGTRPKPTNNI